MEEITDFEYIRDSFLRVYFSYRPTEASSFGWREFAGKLPDISPLSLNAFENMLEKFQSKLEKINRKNLSEVEHLDLLILENKLDQEIFDINILEQYKFNPLSYVGPAFIFDYLLKRYDNLEQRVLDLTLHLNGLEHYFSQAKNNLAENIAPELVQMASVMLKGNIEFVTNLENEIKLLSEDEWNDLKEDIKIDLESAKNTGIRGMRILLEYLEEIHPQCDRSFRYGKEKYTQMLWNHERVKLPIEKILGVGQENLNYNLKEMKKAANTIDSSKSVKEIMQEIKKDHPTEENLITTTQNMLEEIRQFLINSKFVSVPSEVRPTVIETPKPFREWAFAACDTPGPLERVATDSYYYITPPDENWSDKEKEQWLMTFNYKQLKDISVHEIWPGHYLHHLHNQRSKSLMSKLFGAYHFWEGYALHVEEAMYQAGFQQDDYKYRMAQLMETLIRNVRLICSIKLHTDSDFTVKDATELFMESAFLEKKAAESEARRGTFDPGYLNYCLGKLMIEKLKNDYIKEQGANYSNQEFYDTLLSFGAPPVPILRQFILENDNNTIL